MKFSERLESLPDVVAIAAFTFLLVPILAGVELLTFDDHWTHAIAEPASIGAYFVFPLAAAACLLFAPRLFLYLFVAEALAVFEAAYERDPEIGDWSIARFVALLLGLVVFFLLAKDFSATLTGKTPRWRKDPRVELHSRVYIAGRDAATRLLGIVEDYSLSGVAVSTNRERLVEELGNLGKDAELTLVTGAKGERRSVRCTVSWRRDIGDAVLIGLRALDLDAHGAFIDDLSGHKRRGRLERWFARMWAQQRTQRLAVMAWGVFFILALLS